MLGVVDGHATSGAARQGGVVDNRHAVVGAVGGILEIQNGRPVVREILGHLTSGTVRPSPDIAGHRGVEGIPTDDMMKMRRPELAGLDDGVKALDGQRRASKAKASLSWRDEREGD